MKKLNCLHLLPKKIGKSKKLVVVLHGFGKSATDLFDLAKNFSCQLPDAYFILPNAPNICQSNPAGFEWFDLSSTAEDPMLKGLIEASKPLNITVDYYLEKFNCDQLILIGFSQGAILSLHHGLRSKNCSAIVSFAGALIGSSKLLANEILSKPRICLIHGKQDEVVPFSAFKISQRTLQRCNITTEAFAIDNLAHFINQKSIEIATNFLKKIFSQ